MKKFICGMMLPFALIACGSGDGGGGSTGAAPPIVTVPVPSPTPTPTPTPTFSYSTHTLANSFVLNPFVATLRVAIDIPQGSYADARLVSATANTTRDRVSGVISWDASKQEQGVRIGTDLWIFNAENRFPDTPDNGVRFLRYSVTKPSVLETRGTVSSFFAPAKAASYVWIGVLEDVTNFRRAPNPDQETVIHSFVAGSATSQGDMPLTGIRRQSFSLAMRVPNKVFVADIRATGDAVVDFAARTVRVDAVANQQVGDTNNERLAVNIILDARLDPDTGLIEGTARSADGRFSGTASGRFYGPQGRDWGVVVALTSTDGSQPIAGYIVSVP